MAKAQRSPEVIVFRNLRKAIEAMAGANIIERMESKFEIVLGRLDTMGKRLDARMNTLGKLFESQTKTSKWLVGIGVGAIACLVAYFELLGG